MRSNNNTLPSQRVSPLRRLWNAVWGAAEWAAPKVTQSAADVGSHIADYMRYQRDTIRFARVDHEVVAIPGFAQTHALIHNTA